MATDKPDLFCVFCRYPQSQHLAVNYADSPMVGGTVLVCPSATFSTKRTLRDLEKPNPKPKRKAGKEPR